MLINKKTKKTVLTIIIFSLFSNFNTYTTHYVKKLKDTVSPIKEVNTEFLVANKIYKFILKHDKVGKKNSIQKLLEKYKSLKTSNLIWNSFLHLAAKKDRANMIPFLLAYGTDVNVKNNLEYTPLHSAVQNNSTEVIKSLIWYGADVNMKNNRGWTPLHIAASLNYAHIIKLLLKNGADPFQKNCFNKIPLDTAEKFKSAKAANILEKIYRKRFRVDNLKLNSYFLLFIKDVSLDVIKQLIRLGVRINIKDKATGNTALHIAIASNRLDVVELLLNSGADVFEKNLAGQRPLDLAKICNDRNIFNLVYKIYNQRVNCLFYLV